MKTEIINWLQRLEKEVGAPPPEVIAFNFGLFESAKGYMIYIVGAFEYDEKDDDWACIELPQNPAAYLLFPNEMQSKSWENILDYSKNVLTELEKESGFDKTILKNAIAITTGFDEGELIKIR